jgi:hypothetical protein
MARDAATNRLNRSKMTELRTGGIETPGGLQE